MLRRKGKIIQSRQVKERIRRKIILGHIHGHAFEVDPYGRIASQLRQKRRGCAGMYVPETVVLDLGEDELIRRARLVSQAKHFWSALDQSHFRITHDIGG